MQEVRTNLKWADGKDIKSEFDDAILNLLGEKTEADLAPVQKAPKTKAKKVQETEKVSDGK